MNNPVATYRIQLHKDFTLQQLDSLIPYLQQLGVSTVYASPIFAAVPGSNHGYDGIDPFLINPEIGTEEELRAISQKLQEAGISWLQDIVPNHMAFHPQNGWLMDVLEKGVQSIYAPFFDIAWTSNLHKGRLMVPFLGAELKEVVQNGELELAYVDNKFVFKYYDAHFPVSPRSYEAVLKSDKPSEAVKSLVTQIEQLHSVEDRKAYAEGWHEITQQLAGLMKNKTVNTYVEKGLKAFNSNKEALQQLADSQHYRLCHWQETDSRINYRRFFTVNGLICLNIQDESVFQTYHQYIKQLLDEGIFQGLRIDHIDGLYDPSQYLERLRELAGDETYIVVEKILEKGEAFPEQWPVQGNTGYDFLARVNNLLTYRKSEKDFSQFYHQLVKDRTQVERQIHDKKAHILYENMGGELDNLYHLFLELDLVEAKAITSIHPEDIKTAIAEFLIQMPVYRFYGNHFPLEHEEAEAVRQVFDSIRHSGEAKPRAVELLQNVLLEYTEHGNEEYNGRVQHFYQRCMQYSGPLMAKGVEDTLMYTYNRFIGHNEVGDAPDAFGMSKEDFHAAMVERQQQWPLSINATATHDTKRGEDARARLNVLSELPQLWIKTVKEWQELNKDLKTDGAPDAADEYLIYQALVGGYPYEEKDDDFQKRFETFLPKALREAKQHSNWTKPNEAYESACIQFAAALLDKSRPFWKSFHGFLKTITDGGIANSLVQVLLKFTCPGTPDVYQGCEGWDLSLVDPDNRRPIDYGKREKWLQNWLQTPEMRQADTVRQMWEERSSAEIKFWLVHTLFTLRKQQPELFSHGEYIPLKVEGTYKDHVLAFARRHRQAFYVVAVPLYTTALCQAQKKKKILEIDWKDTRIIIPGEVTAEWEHLLNKIKSRNDKGIDVADLFKNVPLALLKMRMIDNARGAGLLMHITSLPSAYGIGDMGPGARAFTDFLSRSRQKYWQLLPLNPTEAGQAHSPYSATSSMAGNPLLISPELLVKDGLLTHNDLAPYRLSSLQQVDYEGAERVKGELFEKAFEAFLGEKGAHLQAAYQHFCKQEAAWLDDFALYMLLKKMHEGQPWFNWPEEYKLREPEALQKLAADHQKELDKVKWLQALFARQWHSLKDYCNAKGIQFVGDLPFYVSYDSADVWAHRHLFALDDEGARTGLAGVPPDAFSDDGQLWGMPVFKWEVHQQEGYTWWIERLKKNMELFDLVRLDHFRAFADYWEVPAGEDTARNGEWKPGPGADFFKAIETALGSLPFVAEDLGEINEPVLKLRDQFHLPGMKVLQFAFGPDMPRSDYIPHNYGQNFFVYTGTHDNNTIRGWFNELDDATRHRLERYVGRPLSAAEVHIELGRMAYASVAKTAILPLQDVLALDAQSRMNIPASGENNWAWRLLPGQLTGADEDRLRQWTILYNRE
ncbi:MAG: malto-oligosyltrehalose synthase [Chitinophagaceae bacterium]